MPRAQPGLTTHQFPTEPGRALSLAFSTIARRMYICLLRVWAHIYHAHFDARACDLRSDELTLSSRASIA